MKREVCANCGGILANEALGWRCKNCRGFISLQDGKFYEYVEKPFIPPRTNADRIRAMSDEELAEWHEDCPYIYEECTMQVCAKCILEWLKQPAE